MAKTPAPRAAATIMTEAVRRGPIWSSQRPTGNCITAKAANQTPEEMARSPGVAPNSPRRSELSTVRKAR